MIAAERVINVFVTNIHRITYTKHFLTGTLAGLSVRCGYPVPAGECATHQARLMAKDGLNQKVHADLITGAQYKIYNIGCEEVAD